MTAPAGPFAPGRAAVLTVASGWQGGATVHDLADGRYAAQVGAGVAPDAFVSSLGSGRFALVDTVTLTHRLRVQGSRVFLDSL